MKLEWWDNIVANNLPFLASSLTRIQFEYGDGGKWRTISGNILATCFDKNRCFGRQQQVS